MAHKKGLGSSRNGRDSNSQRLGFKAFGGQVVPGQVRTLRDQIQALGPPAELPPSRVARLRLLLEQTQRALAARSAQLPPEGKKVVDGLVDAIEVDLDSVFQQALAEGRRGDAVALFLRFVGTPAEQVTPGSPHMCGRPIWVSKFARSDAIFGLPNESMMAIVTP